MVQWDLLNMSIAIGFRLILRIIQYGNDVFWYTKIEHFWKDMQWRYIGEMLKAS